MRVSVRRVCGHRFDPPKGVRGHISCAGSTLSKHKPLPLKRNYQGTFPPGRSSLCSLPSLCWPTAQHHDASFYIIWRLLAFWGCVRATGRPPDRIYRDLRARLVMTDCVPMRSMSLLPDACFLKIPTVVVGSTLSKATVGSASDQTGHM